MKIHEGEPRSTVCALVAVAGPALCDRGGFDLVFLFFFLGFVFFVFVFFIFIYFFFFLVYFPFFFPQDAFLGQLKLVEKTKRLQNRLIMRNHWLVFAARFLLLPLTGKKTFVLFQYCFADSWCVRLFNYDLIVTVFHLFTSHEFSYFIAIIFSGTSEQAVPLVDTLL